MPRFVTTSCALVLAMGLLPGCRPSKADMDAIAGQLGEIRAAQEQLDSRLGQLEEQQSDRDGEGRVERAELENALIDVAVRLAKVEQVMADMEEKARPRPSVNRPDPALTYRVEIGDSPVKGSAKALVTIVMWTDYQCPYCARVQDTLSQIEREYGTKVRFVHKHNPLGFHPRAKPAALAAEAAGRQGKFWKMSDHLFDNQKQLTDENFVKWAKKLGLKTRRFQKDMKDPQLEARIEKDQEQGTALGARGTPAFFINGRFLSGAQPVQNFRKLIDEELEEAERLVRSGVPREKVYETVIADGKRSL